MLREEADSQSDLDFETGLDYVVSGHPCPETRGLEHSAIVGVLTVELSISQSDSLKDKRQVVRSVLQTSRNRFGVAAAEVDLLDSHKSAALAFSTVGNNATLIRSVLQRVLGHIESNPLCEVVGSQIEIS